MSKKIVIRYDDDALFGGDCTGIDQAASAARFGEMAEFAVQQVYPGAEIEIEYGPSMRGDEFRFDGVIDENETENVKEITGEVYQSFQWVVYEPVISLPDPIIEKLKTLPEEQFEAAVHFIGVLAGDEEPNVEELEYIQARGIVPMNQRG